MKIDAHQHFWQFKPIRDSWINDDMAIIKRDFLPQDLWPVLQANGIDGCITVQSDQTEAENNFQLQNAANNNFIKGVVGWVDLQANNIEERLAYYSSFNKMKGFRHVLQGEPQRDLMLQPKFMNGIGNLAKYNFTYDILIFPDQLQFIPQLLQVYPNQKFVIDHIAKPDIKHQNISDWKKDIEAIALFNNVSCKISGMVTEANWQQWQTEDFTSYLDVVVNAFGTKRIMYGSDWPVCLLAANYEQMFGIVTQYFASFSETEQADFFGVNAARFYNL
jgi:L-fuconolactonase